MKKRLLSIALALAMVFTLLPMESLAQGDTDTPPANSENTSEDGSTDQAGEGEEDESGEGSEEEESLLSTDVCLAYHPTHLTEGQVSFTACFNKSVNPGLISYTKGEVETTGSVKVKSWSVDNDAVVRFVVSNAKEGDTITFPVTIHSEFFEQTTLKVLVTIGYDRPTITSADTVAYGSTLKLTCAGCENSGAVIYKITSGQEYATINGDVLTPIKVGTVTIQAVEVPVRGDNSYSELFTITIEKATPSVTATFTPLVRAGQTLSEAMLTSSSSTVDGTIEWVLPGNTIALANASYEWIFVPSDFENYNTVTGTLTPYVVTDEDFAIGSGTTVQNADGSYTTVSYGEDDSRYELTEYPDGKLRMVHRQLDGTIVTTIKEADGARTVTTEKKDGSREIVASLTNSVVYSVSEDQYGRVKVQISLPQYMTTNAAKNGSILTLPIPEIPNTDNRADAPTIVFTISSKDTVRVAIPINNPSAGTVAVIVDKDGRETVVKTSITGKDALYVTLTGSTTIKVVDARKRFKDVTPNDWFHGAADFVTSRGLFQGMDPVTFAPDATMSRAMLVKVLHNLEGNPMFGIFPFFTDVAGTWYADCASWAAYNGYINGFPDNTFRGDGNITREQLAVILYRYVGSPSVNGFVNTPIYDYYDYTNISTYAWTAMYWAVNSGVLYTDGSNYLSPGHDATRAEVAQTFRNLVEYLTR